MNRNKQYYREMREKHIKRKKRLDKKCNGVWSNIPMYSCDGKYSKGKIHCSCYLCSAKTKIDGYKAADKRIFEKMNYKEKESLF